jgi:transcriptional regulator with XRE-family HTH domain
MGNDFTQWLSEQVEDRGWTFNELARRAGLSSGTVSKVMTQAVLPSWDFCAAVAGALGMRPESVLRQAGLLPQLPPRVAEEQEAMALLRELPPVQRGAALAMLRGIAREAGIPVGQPATPAAEAVTTDMERQLLEAFRRLPERWQALTLEEMRGIEAARRGRLIGEEDQHETRAAQNDAA